MKKINKRKTKKNKKVSKKYKGGNSSYTAIIIEPRKHKALSFVLKNILENLNSEWNIIIFHGNLNKDYVENIINTQLQQYKKRISLKSLEKDNLSIEDYNTLLKTKKFYENIPTDIFLLFQTDSMIIPANKDKINDFLQYDYVGAPSWSLLNGGFGLRKKSKMLEILDKCPFEKITDTEDAYFSDACKAVEFNKPSHEIAKNFSSEATWNPNSFGIHCPWKWNNKDIIIKDKPEIDQLINLQSIED
jgi:hypothetical protein